MNQNEYFRLAIPSPLFDELFPRQGFHCSSKTKGAQAIEKVSDSRMAPEKGEACSMQECISLAGMW
jgi:hypothetical protein